MNPGVDSIIFFAEQTDKIECSENCDVTPKFPDTTNYPKLPANVTEVRIRSQNSIDFNLEMPISVGVRMRFNRKKRKNIFLVN